MPCVYKALEGVRILEIGRSVSHPQRADTHSSRISGAAALCRLGLSLIVTGVSLLAGGTALGASFDCAKASFAAEKLVCENPDISQLDDRLARAYRSRLSEARDRGEARRDQARWLSAVRNRCQTVACVRSAYAERLAEVESGAVSDKHCPLVETDLIGSWQRRSGAGFFEEMAFSRDGARRIFDSWLHHRPEIAGGSWKFERCTIYVRHSTEDALNVVFRVTGYRNGKVHVGEEGGSGESIYTRIRP
jgi:uncharacterized protein YecT (DUF1311 family)